MLVCHSHLPCMGEVFPTSSCCHLSVVCSHSMCCCAVYTILCSTGTAPLYCYYTEPTIPMYSAYVAIDSSIMLSDICNHHTYIHRYYSKVTVKWSQPCVRNTHNHPLHTISTIHYTVRTSAALLSSTMTFTQVHMLTGEWAYSGLHSSQHTNEGLP